MTNSKCPLLQSTMWIMRPAYQALKPKLGVLNQHRPRDFKFPANLNKKRYRGDAPKISIVTPSLNQREFIERALNSVLDQCYPNLEYFIQDGASSDGTTDVLACYSDRLTGWSSCPDNGQSHAINVGFSNTSGEIMAWLNSDDIMLPGALAYVANYFSCHPDVDVVYGHRVLLDEHDREIGRWILPSHSAQILSWEDYIPQETMFWRRSIWNRVGGRVDESYRFAMDWDLLVRFRDAGARFVRLPRFLGGFRVHSRQKSSAEISSIGFQEMDRIRQRLLGYVPVQAEIQQAVRIYLIKHVVVDLAWRIRSKLGIS